MNNNYWIKREQQRLNNIDNIVDEHINNLERLIRKSADNLDKEIFKLYVKYADDNNMSYQSTLDYLTDDDRKEFQKDLKYYINSYKDKETILAYKSELQALSTRARVKRLEKLKASLLVEAGRLHEYLMINTKDMLSSIYEESYLYKMYSIDQAGLGVKFDLPPVGIINELLNYPWSGKNYSSKVWDKTNNFTEKVGEVMTQGLVQGKSMDSIVKDMRNSILGKKGKGGRIYDYKRLVRTEAAFIAEQATIRSYNDANVERYEYLSTLDLRTSIICQRLDGKKFLVKDAKTMVNYPPMHAFCRSTTIPVIKWDGPEDRIARDPITGKNYYTKDISYDDWKDNVYTKYGKEVDIEKSKIKNKSNDILQYKRYKKELKDLVPKDFEMFQNLKYNNKEEWNKLAYRYKLETVYNLDRLKNTSNFANKKAIKHILEGEINKRGKAVGFHLENLPTAKGKIIGQKTPEDKNGIYKAKVEVDGVVKDAKSTFFPTDMIPQQIVNAINEAYKNKEPYFIKSMMKGKTSYGFDIGMYLDQNGKITTAFPLKEE
jgi:SPP1 gp7 family putative phage head morphogenesis protein